MAGRRFLQLALRLQNVPQVDVSLGQIRTQDQRAPEAHLRQLVLALRLPYGAQIHLRLGQPWIEDQRPLIAGCSLFQLAQRLISRTQVGVKRRRPPVAGNRLADQLNGYVVAAHLMSQNSQQVQAVGMMGIELQNLPVDALRLG